MRHAIWRELILIVLGRRVEQVIGKPCLVGYPQQRQQQQRQPPLNENAQGEQYQQADQQLQALVAPVALEQLLLATHT
ncbi:hypothetical protein D3C84_998130 [compost metagenome]